MATSDQGRYLDDVPTEFWELASGLGVPVFVHPGGDIVGDHLYTSYRLGEVCGRPLDMTVTLARFILFGISERFPDVRLLCAHGGGGICMIADRLDFGHELRNYAPLGPWGEVELGEPPSHHVARLYLDPVTYGPRPLRLALEHRRCGASLFRDRRPTRTVRRSSTPRRRRRPRAGRARTGGCPRR